MSRGPHPISQIPLGAARPWICNSLCVCVSVCVHTCVYSACVCMCPHMCVYPHMCVHVHKCPHVCIHTCVCMCPQVCIQLCMCPHTCVPTHVHVFTCPHVCTHACVSMSMLVHSVYVYPHLCAHMPGLCVSTHVCRCHEEPAALGTHGAVVNQKWWLSRDVGVVGVELLGPPGARWAHLQSLVAPPAGTLGRQQWLPRCPQAVREPPAPFNRCSWLPDKKSQEH